MSEEYDKLVNFKAASETVEKAKSKLDHGEMSRRLRETLQIIAHGSDVAERERVKDALADKRDEKRDIDRRITELQSESEDLQRDIERLEERLDVLMEQESEYEGYLKGIESDLHEGKHVFVGHGKIEEAAAMGECTQEDVIETLKERNPDLPDSRFEEKGRRGI